MIRYIINCYLTSIKPLKYSSILKMQEDDSRRKAERDFEILNADKKQTGINSVEEFPKEDSEKEFETDNYINESMSILLDYIKLQQQSN